MKKKQLKEKIYQICEDSQKAEERSGDIKNIISSEKTVKFSRPRIKRKILIPALCLIISVSVILPFALTKLNAPGDVETSGGQSMEVSPQEANAELAPSYFEDMYGFFDRMKNNEYKQRYQEYDSYVHLKIVERIGTVGSYVYTENPDVDWKYSVYKAEIVHTFFGDYEKANGKEVFFSVYEITNDIVGEVSSCFEEFNEFICLIRGGRNMGTGLINTKTGDVFKGENAYDVFADNMLLPIKNGKVYPLVNRENYEAGKYYYTDSMGMYLDSFVPFFQFEECLESVYRKLTVLPQMAEKFIYPPRIEKPGVSGTYYDTEKFNPYKQEDLYDSVYEYYFPETEKTAFIHAEYIDANETVYLGHIFRVIEDFYGVYEKGEIIYINFPINKFDIEKTKEYLIKIPYTKTMTAPDYELIEVAEVNYRYGVLPIIDEKLIFPEDGKLKMTSDAFAEPLFIEGEPIAESFKRLRGLKNAYKKLGVE